MKSVLAKILTLWAFASLLACGAQTTQSIPYGGSLANCVGIGCVTVAGASVAEPFVSGDTETLNPVSEGILSEYVGYQLQNPGPVQVNIALDPQTANNVFSGGTNQVYMGSMTIRFQDGAVLHNGTFSNGSDPNQAYTSYDKNNNKVTYYNNVSTQIANNYRVFFEDQIGALVLVINSSTTTGTDTGSTQTASGQIYFYNFPQTGAPNPLFSGITDPSGNYFPPGDVFCWEINLGPYNCRNFNLPPSVSYTDPSGGQTISGFTLLGTIPTINLVNALGI